MTTSFRSVLLAGAALVLVTPAIAAPAAKKAAASDPRINVLEQQLRDVQQQLAEIKGAQSANDYSGAVTDLKRSTSDQYADINNRFDSQTKVGLDNGRLTFASANGNFTLSLRSLVQLDVGYFAQGKNPANVDLNSGSNFRRAQFGFVGTAWKDWAYNFTYDFGGNGIEKNGYIYSAYVEYDGFKPFGVRVGAFAPPAGIEDATGSADLLFLERPSASDIARNIAGSPGREAISIFAQGDNYLFSVAYTGKKATDAATFDSQQAVVSRASWLAVNNSDVKWLLDADVSHVFKIADTTANTDTSNFFSLSNGPELAIDATKTVNTGNIDAKAVTEWGLETAAVYGPLYGQGGYFHYDIERRTALPSPDFDGWYALATWSLTGESHAYDPITASFRGLRPTKPLGTPGGWGAWELKGRYSAIDLDYNPFVAASAGGVAGGKQDVWTVGVNWYPTNGLRFALDYDNISVNHINAPANDISASAIALRSQISF
ncbi:MAG TPA: porin [Rhizomicrobium sp.]|jgi:phosphate-selective porin OprO/OprP